MANKQEYSFSKLVALFLAEVIRSRQMSLRRAAEVSVLVVEALPNLDSEEKTLSFLTQVEHDFEEVGVLKQALNFKYEESDIKVYEKEIKDYAAQIFQADMVASTRFLQDAIQPEMNIQKLCIMYPKFCLQLQQSAEKEPLLKKLALSY